MHTASDVRKRLGKLPKSLGNSYQELYDRKFGEYEPEDRKRLEVALSLLLVSQTSVDPGVFSNFVFWDSEEDEENEDEDEADEDEEDEDQEDEDEEIAYSGNENEKTDTGDDSDSGGDLEHPDANDEVERSQTSEDSDTYEQYDEPGSQQYEGVTRLCFDLIVFDSTACVLRFAHTSVQDYLVNHNPSYQILYDSHARVAERCISILLYFQSRRSHCPKFPIDEEQIRAWESVNKSPEVMKNREESQIEGNAGKRPMWRLMNLKKSKYTKVHKERLDVETLDAYELPWRWDEASHPKSLTSCIEANLY